MRWIVAVLAAIYLLSGTYVVGSHEQAVVRRFGRMLPDLRSSGIYWDWPTPFVQIDRVNVAELHTLTIGATSSSAELLLEDAPQRLLPVLTGDDNILRVRASVQYRINPEGIREHLFSHREQSAELESLLEGCLVEAVAQAGVDFVQTSGIGALNRFLTLRVQQSARELELGIDVDRVTIDAIEPPPQVLADFLDVANARSEAAQVVQQARTFAEQRESVAAARAQETTSQAQGDRREASVAATAKAQRFEGLVDELERGASVAGEQYLNRRRRYERQLTRELYRDLVAAGIQAWVFDSTQPIDLQFLRPDK